MPTASNYDDIVGDPDGRRSIFDKSVALLSQGMHSINLLQPMSTPAAMGKAQATVLTTQSI